MPVNITNIRQFEKVSLREQVSHALRAAIVSGELEPGVVYSAPALGSRFGVSATPVREAMLDLVHENLVTTVPNKGFRVTTIDEGDLDEITELRLLIEPPLAAQVTSVIPAADLPTLRGMAEAIVEGALAGDLVAYTEADRAFHLRLLEYAGNSRITDLSPTCAARPGSRTGRPAGERPAGRVRRRAPRHRGRDRGPGRRPGAAADDAHIGHVRGRWAGRPER